MPDVTDSAKFDRMEELVDDAVENGKKVVIFSNWTQITNTAFKRLSKKYKGVMITGETKDSERQANVEAFQNDDRVKFIIGTIGAMGTGLTMTAGSVEIFLDEPWNMALKEQAIDRCHRIGQNSNITVYTLLCRDTIDERINSLVEKKGKMSEILIDGKIQGDKNALINYLLS
jgi:SNF2 family DNA or RNA helicase